MGWDTFGFLSSRGSAPARNGEGSGHACLFDGFERPQKALSAAEVAATGKTLRAIHHKTHGDLDKLEMVDVPDPQPKNNEVRIKVAACGLNHLDLWTLRGIEGVTIPLPHIPGSDIAGTIDQVGEGVGAWKAGDRVVVNPSLWCGTCEYCVRGDINYCVKYGIIGEHVDGGLAQLFKCPTKHLLRVPEGFAFEAAAAAALAYQTAWRMVVVRGGLKAGEWVLVNGAGGGVATAAIQIAKLGGAHVIATTSTEEKAKRAREVGADYVFNYKAQEFDREVYTMTDKRGVDLIIDNVGDATWKKNLRALARGGRIAICGATSGNNPPAMINMLYWKNIAIHGSTMGTWHDFERVMGLVFSGKLKPVVDQFVSIERYRDAFARLDKGEQFGKIVLQP